MASPMPETITISTEEYANLLMTQESAYHLHRIIIDVANTPEDVELVDTRQFARNLLDEWTK